VKKVWRENVKLQDIKDEEVSKKIDLDLKLYAFNLTRKQLEEMLVYKGAVLHKLSQGYTNSLLLVRAEKVIVNERDSLHLVVWSNGQFSLFNKEAKCEDIPMIYRGWGKGYGSIWDDLKEGVYAVFAESWKTYELACLTDCKTEEEAKKWVALYTECLRLKDKYYTYEEFNSVEHLSEESIVTLANLEDYKKKIDETVKKIERLEARELVLKNTALQERIKIEGNKITIKGLDDHTYEIEADVTWKKEDFASFVYRHRYNWKPSDQSDVKLATLFPSLIEKLRPWISLFKLSVDGKDPVKIETKIVKNRRGQPTTMTYLDDRRVAFEDMYQALWNYFIKGSPLVHPAEEKEEEKKDKEELLNIKKQREEKLTAEGISGYITDLEGETPITLGFEKVKNNWYLVIGEKKILLKGGIETIHSLERVLKGTAQGYNARHSTEEFYNRLSRVLSPEEALEIITEAKQLGKLCKAIGPNSNN